jgi:hypothetical protein
MPKPMDEKHKAKAAQLDAKLKKAMQTNLEARKALAAADKAEDEMLKSGG